MKAIKECRRPYARYGHNEIRTYLSNITSKVNLKERKNFYMSIIGFFLYKYFSTFYKQPIFLKTCLEALFLLGDALEKILGIFKSKLLRRYIVHGLLR